MKSQLSYGEMCPLHKSLFCCGRKVVRAKSERPGIKLILDAHHPRGFREKHSPSLLQKRKHTLMSTRPICFYCKKNFLDDKTPYSEIELCHIEPKGNGGARHDDHPDNTTLGHKSCNRANGSKRPTVRQFGQFQAGA